jgi:hypothetical protein
VELALGCLSLTFQHGKLGAEAHCCVSPGQPRGGQGALGKQLRLLSDALQPHRLVRTSGRQGMGIQHCEGQEAHRRG